MATIQLEIMIKWQFVLYSLTFVSSQSKMSHFSEVIQELLQVEKLGKNLGGYSNAMNEDDQNIMNYIKATCTDSTPGFSSPIVRLNFWTLFVFLMRIWLAFLKICGSLKEVTWTLLLWLMAISLISLCQLVALLPHLSMKPFCTLCGTAILIAMLFFHLLKRPLDWGIEFSIIIIIEFNLNQTLCPIAGIWWMLTLCYSEPLDPCLTEIQDEWLSWSQQQLDPTCFATCSRQK